MFYVYEWFIKDSGEVIYVGKGRGRRIEKHNKRNKAFLEIVEKFDCASRKIYFTEDENDAFNKESERISELHNIGQAKCNRYYGGNGGTSGEWTDEMRNRMSENNPMKDLEQRKRMSAKNPMKDSEQRKRMSVKNPMKNKSVSEKVGKKHRRAVVINGEFFDGLISAADKFNVTSGAVMIWCKNGYNPNRQPCRYSDEEQKPFSKNKPILPFCKAVIIGNKNRFDKVQDAAAFLKISPSTLIRHLKTDEQFNGISCRYDNQQPSATCKD